MLQTGGRAGGGVPARRSLAAAPAVLGAVMTLVACSPGSAATPSAPSLSAGPDAADTACTKLLGRLPGTVLSRPRNTARTPAGTATWGSPAITLRCGVAPTGPTSQSAFEVDGVCWVIDQTSAGVTYLTYGREPAVEVSVPASVDPTQASGALVDLTAAVRPVPGTGRRCLDVADTDPTPS